MENRFGARRPTALQERDDFARERIASLTSPRGPQPPHKALILSVLAVLLVVTVAGTFALVLRDLRAQPTSAPSAATTPSTSPTATVHLQPTSVPIDPKVNGWNQFTPNVYSGDVTFAPSNSQRGYLCGQGPDERVFAVTTNGGKAWQTSRSPAQFSECSLQVSPTNALDVAVMSHEGSFGSDSPTTSLDAHYSSDGGATWKAAPIPSGTRVSAGAVWSGPYLYVWSGPSPYDQQNVQQKNYLAVSANGGAFVSIDPSKLLSGTPDVSIESALAAYSNFYLNLGYTCAASQTCQAIVVSVDGGQTWTQIPNQSSIQLVGVMGSSLYGEAPNPQNPKTQVEMIADNNSSAWAQLKLPPIPNAPAGTPIPLAIPAQDGTLFTSLDSIGVAYLNGTSWTVIPFSRYGEGIHVAVATDPNGKPATVWAVDDGNDSQAGIYWHPLP